MIAENSSNESKIFDLRKFAPVKTNAFAWYDQTDTIALAKTIEHAYDEIVLWHRNPFNIPFGAAGRAIVLELSRLILAYVEGSSQK